VGGSWIAPRDLIQKKEWATITANAHRAFEKI
jgi:2-keto-3-deoxy-6-phosphogluconate aldolase